MARLQGAVGHHHADHTAVLQVQVDAAGKEQPSHVLMGGVSATCPDSVGTSALPLQLRSQGADGLVVVQPRRVADDCVDLAAGQGHRPHQIAGVVGPDVVAALGVQPLHSGDSLPQGLPLP